jgi:hypothetical protein
MSISVEVGSVGKIALEYAKYIGRVGGGGHDTQGSARRPIGVDGRLVGWLVIGEGLDISIVDREHLSGRFGVER